MSEHDGLVSRAKRVIPGTMYGHMSVQRMMPEGYPQFFARAEGSRLWDADGNEYIDLMCSFGPMILGYGHPAVEAAADVQRRLCDTATGPAPVMVELAERFTAGISHADWCMFMKNGTDATTLCLTLARAETGRRKMLVAKGAYHGSDPWCTPTPAGVTDEDRAHLIPYRYNSLKSLEGAVEEAGSDWAGLMVSAFRHDAFADQELSDPEFARRARELCDAGGAALILDDVRAGFRLSLDASWSELGVQPDLSAWGKALANGYPISAVAGSDRFRSAATQVFATGSFWYQAVPMAAGVATLAELQACDAPRKIERSGLQLRAGLAEQAARHGLSLRQTGPVQMPMVLFDEDPDLKKGFRFCQEALRRGVYLHPWHNWFLSTAHSEADIERVLEVTDAALAAVRSESS